MKIFISQKTENKTDYQLSEELTNIENAFYFFRKDPFVQRTQPREWYKVKSDDLSRLCNSLTYLTEADIVLVPIIAEQNIRGFIHDNITQCNEGDYEPWLETIDKLNFDDIRGCEFEFLIAKSYGKKVYTYDDSYNFEEV